MRQKIEAPAPPPGPAVAVPEAFVSLTPREVDVMRLVARGLRNDEIAQELFDSEATVRTHVVPILAKPGLRDRTRVAIAAYEHGLVAAGHP